MKCFSLIAVLASVGLASQAAGLKVPPINPYAEQAALTGKFIWFDLVTDDVDGARRFYTELFGWNFQTYGQGESEYTVILHRKRPIGGLVVEKPSGEDRNENQWVGYISVPDVKDTVKAVKKGAGEVLLAPTKLPGHGSYAVFTDPEGAVFAVCHSSSGDPPDYQPQVNEWLWAECWSHAPAKAARFYRSIGDYTISKVAVDTDHVALHLKSQGFGRAGVVRIPEPEIKPGWLYYVRVENLDETIKRAESLGGKVLMAPSDSPDAAHIAIIEDPTGAPFGIAAWNPVPPRKGD